VKLVEQRRVSYGGSERALWPIREGARFFWEDDEAVEWREPIAVDDVPVTVIERSLRYGSRMVTVELSGTLAFEHAPRLAEPGFEAALEAAAATGLALDAARAREAADYWQFHVSEIGVRAVVVDKVTLRATRLGSGLGTLDDALSAYEAGELS
jgi:hypothetical protein